MPNNCPSCFRPYPQESFVKILGPDISSFYPWCPPSQDSQNESVKKSIQNLVITVVSSLEDKYREIFGQIEQEYQKQQGENRKLFEQLLAELKEQQNIIRQLQEQFDKEKSTSQLSVGSVQHLCSKDGQRASQGPPDTQLSYYTSMAHSTGPQNASNITPRAPTQHAESSLGLVDTKLHHTQNVQTQGELKTSTGADKHRCKECQVSWRREETRADNCSDRFYDMIDQVNSRVKNLEDRFNDFQQYSNQTLNQIQVNFNTLTIQIKELTSSLNETVSAMQQSGNVKFDCMKATQRTVRLNSSYPESMTDTDTGNTTHGHDTEVLIIKAADNYVQKCEKKHVKEALTTNSPAQPSHKEPGQQARSFQQDEKHMLLQAVKVQSAPQQTEKSSALVRRSPSASATQYPKEVARMVLQMSEEQVQLVKSILRVSCDGNNQSQLKRTVTFQNDHDGATINLSQRSTRQSEALAQQERCNVANGQVRSTTPTPQQNASVVANVENELTHASGFLGTKSQISQANPVQQSEVQRQVQSVFSQEQGGHGVSQLQKNTQSATDTVLKNSVLQRVQSTSQNVQTQTGDDTHVSTALQKFVEEQHALRQSMQSTDSLASSDDTGRARPLRVVTANYPPQYRSVFSNSAFQQPQATFQLPSQVSAPHPTTPGHQRPNAFVGRVGTQFQPAIPTPSILRRSDIDQLRQYETQLINKVNQALDDNQSVKSVRFSDFEVVK